MKFSEMKMAGLAALAASLPGADAFFRMPCSGPLLLERSDPIVNPGAVSGHLHNIVGGGAFNFSMTYEDARNAACTTCKAKADRSNYWIPDLYVKTKAGKFHNVQNGGALIYYLQRRDTPDEKLYAFPEGFRMLAGDPFRRSLDGSIDQQGISFSCLGGTTGETHEIPNSKCPNGLRAQIVMPSCWDGVNLDSADHKSHVAYPSQNNNGKCPATHPKRFITLFYEYLYDIASWDDEWVDGKHPFTLANGDPTGYGLHGDFLNGWDVPILQRAIDECNDDSGVIEDCAVLELHTNEFNNDCMVAPSVKEDTNGVFLDRLPGCNPIQPGPERAVQQTGCGAPTTIGPKETFSTDVSSKGWEYVDCTSDDINDRTLPYRETSNDMTIPKCIDICTAKSYTYAGLQYSTECWCGNSVAADRLGSSKCTMRCGGDDTQYCGGPAKLSLYKKSSAAKSIAPRSCRRHAKA